MNKNFTKELAPILSVLIVILTLFIIVFLKMEVRRQGYIVYKKSKQLKKLSDNYRFNMIEYVNITRPDRLRYLALTKLTLSEAKKGQIIQVTGEKIALPH